MFPMRLTTMIASPAARAKPTTIPAAIPGRAARRTASPALSERVAPRASAASRWLRGTASSAERLRAAIVGRIMIARTTLAVSTSNPVAVRANGPNPPVPRARAGSTVPPIQGATTRIAQNPQTTEGTAADRSTIVAIGRRHLFGANSVRKSATPIPTGTARSRASALVSSVPRIPGSAP